MTLISLSMPFEVRVCMAILSFAACAVFLSIRVYHWRLQKLEDTKLGLTGILCMVLALLYCLEILITELWVNTGNSMDAFWCELSMKLITVTYTLHRIIVYIFIILRLELLIQIDFVSSRTIFVGKAVIGVSGTF